MQQKDAIQQFSQFPLRMAHNAIRVLQGRGYKEIKGVQQQLAEFIELKEDCCLLADASSLLYSAARVASQGYESATNTLIFLARKDLEILLAEARQKKAVVSWVFSPLPDSKAVTQELPRVGDEVTQPPRKKITRPFAPFSQEEVPPPRRTWLQRLKDFLRKVLFMKD